MRYVLPLTNRRSSLTSNPDGGVAYPASVKYEHHGRETDSGSAGCKDRNLFLNNNDPVANHIATYYNKPLKYAANFE
jgi:hypothetical protein